MPAKNPLGQDKLVRQALDWSIDREALIQVVFEGAFSRRQPALAAELALVRQGPPGHGRDVAKAKELMKEAGVDKVDVELQVSNSPLNQQIGQVIQSMAAEAGINIKLVTKEFATMLNDQSAGNFQATQVGWSGRVDPDGNIYSFVVTGAGLNDGHYSNPDVDKLLNDARLTTDEAKRKEDYSKAMNIMMDELPIIYLWHQVWFWGVSPKVQGFTPYPDGMIRLQGVSMGG